MKIELLSSKINYDSQGSSLNIPLKFELLTKTSITIVDIHITNSIGRKFKAVIVNKNKANQKPNTKIDKSTVNDSFHLVIEEFELINKNEIKINFVFNVDNDSVEKEYKLVFFANNGNVTNCKIKKDWKTLRFQYFFVLFSIIYLSLLFWNTYLNKDVYNSSHFLNNTSISTILIVLLTFFGFQKGLFIGKITIQFKHILTFLNNPQFFLHKESYDFFSNWICTIIITFLVSIYFFIFYLFLPVNINSEKQNNYSFYFKDPKSSITSHITNKCVYVKDIKNVIIGCNFDSLKNKSNIFEVGNVTTQYFIFAEPVFKRYIVEADYYNSFYVTINDLLSPKDSILKQYSNILLDYMRGESHKPLISIREDSILSIQTMSNFSANDFLCYVFQTIEKNTNGNCQNNYINGIKNAELLNGIRNSYGYYLQSEIFSKFSSNKIITPSTTIEFANVLKLFPQYDKSKSFYNVGTEEYICEYFIALNAIIHLSKNFVNKEEIVSESSKILRNFIDKMISQTKFKTFTMSPSVINYYTFTIAHMQSPAFLENETGLFNEYLIQQNIDYFINKFPDTKNNITTKALFIQKLFLNCDYNKIHFIQFKDYFNRYKNKLKNVELRTFNNQITQNEYKDYISSL